MFPVNISFRHMKPSEAINKRIRNEALKLNRIYNRIQSCSVVFSVPHQTHNQGKIYHINIKLHIPGQILIVNHEPERNHAHEDAFVAVRDAFRSMENELMKSNRKRNHKQNRGLKNVRNDQNYGTINRLNNLENYGFIKDVNQVEYYFHENSILNTDFSNLHEGNTVKFTAEMGEKGPQASSLSLISSRKA